MLLYDESRILRPTSLMSEVLRNRLCAESRRPWFLSPPISLGRALVYGKRGLRGFRTNEDGPVWRSAAERLHGRLPALTAALEPMQRVRVHACQCPCSATRPEHARSHVRRRRACARSSTGQVVFHSITYRSIRRTRATFAHSRSIEFRSGVN